MGMKKTTHKLRGCKEGSTQKVIAINAYILKKERFHFNNQNFYLVKLDKEVQNKHKVSRRKEIRKKREIDNRKTIQKA